MQGQKALAAASVAGTQGQLAQVLPCLAPTFMLNTQHQDGPTSQENRHVAFATAAPSTLTTGLKLDAV